MTHRSRSGGPTRGRKAGGNKRVPKLHHPPDPTRASLRSAAVDEEDEEEVDPVPKFTDAPGDEDVLAVLRDALSTSLNSPEFTADVQRAKSLLYDRKWLELFTDDKLLGAYAGRWVPSRALCFRDLMAELGDVRAFFIGEGVQEDDDDSEDEEGVEGTEKTDEKEKDTGSAGKHILSIGGGAGSELLAIAALCASASPKRPIQWTGVDIGDWSSILDRIEVAARDKWSMDATFNFIECNVLVPGPATSTVAPAPGPAFLAPLPNIDLTTIFFTLTELLSQSRAATVALLRALTTKSEPGSLLLVVDSASDIAEFPLGKDGRTWPVYMVLDALVSMIGGWEKVRSTDSKWFRLDTDVVAAAQWPCKLENARYWMRMYRRT